ncbi:MAG: CDP-alcohol phosphatidyltransferase family protein [Alistipes sp.]|nr:CDP-alcohol phosphatidyltransferase family protein [Alistipes sp.]
MKKHLANIVTSLRIIFSCAMLFCPPFSALFYILYSICGISDMVDGTIARRTNSATEFGTRLDTIADTIFAGIVRQGYICSIAIKKISWVSTLKYSPRYFGWDRTKICPLSQEITLIRGYDRNTHTQ